MDENLVNEFNNLKGHLSIDIDLLKMYDKSAELILNDFKAGTCVSSHNVNCIITDLPYTLKGIRDVNLKEEAITKYVMQRILIILERMKKENQSV